MGAVVAPVSVVGTFDTKAEEVCFIAEALPPRQIQLHGSRR